MENNVRFRPSDIELIMQLLKYVAGKCLPTEELIVFADVYSKEPWQLIGDTSKKTHYFLTQLKHKKPSDDRFNRTTCSGSWIQQDKGQKIHDEDDNLISGYKRSLNYKNKKDPSLNGRWMIKEYFLADSLLQLKSKEAKEFVICAIKKNPRSEVRGNNVATDIEYKRFIDRVFQEGVFLQTSPSEQSTMMLSDNSPVMLESTSTDFFPVEKLEQNDGMLVLENRIDCDEFFGMLNVENQECYIQEGDEVEFDWNSILDFGDHGLEENCLLY